MLTHPTLEQMRALKLDGMADAFAELQVQDASNELGHAEWLALVCGVRIMLSPSVPAVVIVMPPSAL